ncbi:hypothetical protein TpMuguga_03g00671 [Theileria parva strain Muguga]|uniref:Uncharacterized protein n=1 Tax=Theileria parva TaxID=5875 RepID=Q4MZ20_THEPA|nr:uncharacterized protein TpMuguga_03g00671 [Theileria parva strain Muguga]EAN30512.1 hypothetical protein TpMuguga_03g00671 [Theileria parva strain Muguga]|eukprot:XP_762795.1 hypothetical protein [Theileria parva strain Muguga]
MIYFFKYIFFSFVLSRSLAVSQTKSKINIPYISPVKNNSKKGTVILDGSTDGNGELPFVEITNADGYFYKSPQEYKDTSYAKRERELEELQSKNMNHFDFLNPLIGNLTNRI